MYKAILNCGTSSKPFYGMSLGAILAVCYFTFHLIARYTRGSVNTLADSISRLHEPKHMYELLPMMRLSSLGHQMSEKSFIFLFSRSSGSDETGIQA